GGNVMDRPTENKPMTVPERAKQIGETQAETEPDWIRWAWVEPAVWTARMLTALERGVKGGQWFSLVDKVYALPNLHAAFAQVKANAGAAGVDHQTIEIYEQRLAENLGRLAASLRDGSYRPQAVRRVWIPKPGSREQRPLGIPTVQDRVAQAALANVIEPIFERDFAEHSYGFRPARSCKDALRRVEELLKAGFTWVVDADLKSYFDTIPHAQLLERVSEKIADGRVLNLIQAFLSQGVLSEGKELAPEAGTPQGGVISPLLANIYLDPLDRLVAQAGFEMVRYADDFVILCRSEAEALSALNQVRQWTVQAGLTLHPEKTRIVDWAASDGFDFLGYHFGPDRKWPSRKSLKKFKDAIRIVTGRNNGQSLRAIIADLNPLLSGWFEYFKHAHHYIFKSLDSWIRMRLRSILRRRQGRYGRSRGTDQVRWPNAYFEARGLHSLASAHARASQSSRR
ncbi:MAG: group II intron reverse transcriptase/maturase, partial [Acidobacteriota bacterium]